MDPRYAGETLKHLEVEHNLLMEAHHSMSNELHILKVEEEMLMRKFYELMTAHEQTKIKAASSPHEVENKQECSKDLSLCDQVTNNKQ